ncbi:MAG: hypothetical protein AABZ60_16470 [Planctomycetota bacterium]
MQNDFNATENNVTEKSLSNETLTEPSQEKSKTRVTFIEFSVFLIIIFCFVQLTSRWFTMACYLNFLDGFQITSPLFSGIVGSVFSVCVLSLYLPFISHAFPRSLLAGALFLNGLAGGVVFGLHVLAPDLGNYGAVLFGGFLGFLGGGAMALFLGLAFDESDNFQHFVSIVFSLFGMFAFSAFLGYLMTTYPNIFGFLVHLLGIGALVFGGILGYASSFLITWILLKEGINNFFKLLICAFCAGQSVQIAYQSFQQLL